MFVVKALFLPLLLLSALVAADITSITNNWSNHSDTRTAEERRDRELGNQNRRPRFKYAGRRNLGRCEGDCKGNNRRCSGNLVCRYAANGGYSKYCRGKPDPGLDYCVPRRSGGGGGGYNSNSYGGGSPSRSYGGGNFACTLDVKTCPDGSTVSRVPPSCEFAACHGGGHGGGYGNGGYNNGYNNNGGYGGGSPSRSGNYGGGYNNNNGYNNNGYNNHNGGYGGGNNGRSSRSGNNYGGGYGNGGNNHGGGYGNHRRSGNYGGGHNNNGGYNNNHGRGRGGRGHGYRE